MQTSLSLESSSFPRPQRLARAGRRPTARVRDTTPAPCARKVVSLPPRRNPAPVPEDSEPGSARGAIALQVLRDGVGLAGLALWGWACLRLLGAA